MVDEIVIGNKRIGAVQSPFIVAELSANHLQSLDRAFKLIRAASEAGAHAIKLQTYTPDTMTLNIRKKDFFIEDSSSLWKGKYLYDLYQEAFTPWAWHKHIFDLCKKLKLIAFSTAYDFLSVDFLETLNVPAYKIASFENIDLPLIQKVAQTKKPLIISTGMATEKEIEEAVMTARQAGCTELILLKCTSMYPSVPSETNVLTIPYLKEKFHCPIGFSDHSKGIGASLAAIAHGAVMIERHLTLSRQDGGVDGDFSLEPLELKELVTESQRCYEALGTIFLQPTEGEKNSLRFRRSLYITQDLEEGTVLKPEHIRSIRPAFGLPPKYFTQVIGKKTKKKVSAGTALNWELLE